MGRVRSRALGALVFAAVLWLAGWAIVVVTLLGARPSLGARLAAVVPLLIAIPAAIFAWAFPRRLQFMAAYARLRAECIELGTLIQQKVLNGDDSVDLWAPVRSRAIDLATRLHAAHGVATPTETALHEVGGLAETWLERFSESDRQGRGEATSDAREAAHKAFSDVRRDVRIGALEAASNVIVTASALRCP
jgi:hypothetical protein